MDLSHSVEGGGKMTTGQWVWNFEILGEPFVYLCSNNLFMNQIQDEGTS